MPADSFARSLAQADPTPAETVLLAKAHMRRQIGRLQDLDTTRKPKDLDVGWLGPEMYWHLHDARRTEELLGDHALLTRMVGRNRGPGAQLDVATGDDGLDWVTDLIASMNREISAVAPAGRLFATTASESAECLDTVRRAYDTLREVWPEAAVEIDLLLRCVVAVRSAWYRSGCAFEYFGSTVVALDSITSNEAAVEFLLHETGHTAHHLKRFFAVYLENGNDLVSHPLRPDPRPLSGTLHAAHSLYRMTVGLSRMGERGYASAEQRDRLLTHRCNLGHTLDVLAESARWTPAGEQLFTSMQKAL